MGSSVGVMSRHKREPMVTGTTAKAVLVSELFPGRVLTLEKRNGKKDIPGGQFQPGELARRGLVREIEEELGKKVRLYDICELAKTTKPQGNHSEHAYIIYAARLILPKQGLTLSDEHIAFSWDTADSIKGSNMAPRYRKTIEAHLMTIHGLVRSPTDTLPTIEEVVRSEREIEAEPDIAKILGLTALEVDRL